MEKKNTWKELLFLGKTKHYGTIIDLKKYLVYLYFTKFPLSTCLKQVTIHSKCFLWHSKHLQIYTFNDYDIQNTYKFTPLMTMTFKTPTNLHL